MDILSRGKRHLRLIHRLIADLVPPDSRVLDLGCGDGALLESLIRTKGVKGFGIERDEQAIYQCVAKGITVAHGDIDEGLADYPDTSFDYVILCYTITETRDPVFVIREALRVGNHVVIAFPNFANWQVVWQIVFRARTPVTPVLPHPWFSTPNLHVLTLKDFIDLCVSESIFIERRFYLGDNKRVMLMPSLRAVSGVFVITKDRPETKSSPVWE